MSSLKYFLSSAFHNLWESKVTTLFTALTLAVALGFMGTYLAVFINMRAALGAVEGGFPLTVYLSDRVGQAQLAAVQARIKGWQVAGKTGTAQKFDHALRRYSKQKYTASFIGFAPADDPKLSAIVVVNEPKGQYYGGLVAAPAFKNIIQNTLTYMRVPSRLPEQTILVESR